MSHPTDATALVVFIALFAFVTVLGFVAARWRRGNLAELNEWGLGGKRFGSVVTWFLLGGDLYTAYTFIAVPALVFGVGAVGFFALPYTILIYPLAFLALPRLWSVAHRRGYVTPADFVRGRYGSRPLAAAIAGTRLLATMPYIALRLVGIRVVLQAMGVQGDWPLILAFVILAAYTYNSGLRAPALIAVVKDTLIYITVLVAVIYIPSKLGGFGAIFDKADAALPKHTPKPGSLLPGTVDAQTTYASLALGSALALFLYPHAITGALSSRSADVIRRNAAVLPAYSFLLGLIALLGYMAIAAGIKPSDPSFAVPDLFIAQFPSWFTGFAFAAIAIGALVPAAVMSIAAANLFTRNIWREYVHRTADDHEQTRVARWASLVMKAGALAFVLFLPQKDAINLQLLGGVWIIQTLPAVMIGLFVRFFDRRALLVGWLAGMVAGTWIAASQSFTPTWATTILGVNVNAYTAIWSLLLNLIVTTGLTLLIRAVGKADDRDETTLADYDERIETGRPAPVAAAPTG